MCFIRCLKVSTGNRKDDYMQGVTAWPPRSSSQFCGLETKFGCTWKRWLVLISGSRRSSLWIDHSNDTAGMNLEIVEHGLSVQSSEIQDSRNIVKIIFFTKRTLFSWLSFMRNHYCVIALRTIQQYFITTGY